MQCIENNNFEQEYKYQGTQKLTNMYVSKLWFSPQTKETKWTFLMDKMDIGTDPNPNSNPNP